MHQSLNNTPTHKLLGALLKKHQTDLLAVLAGLSIAVPIFQKLG